MTNSSNGGIGLLGLTFLVLLVLKLTGLANLTWFWVFFPLMLGLGVWLTIVIIVGIIALIAWILS